MLLRVLKKILFNGEKIWFYLFISLFALCYSCGNSKLKGTIGISQNILDSKERKVFVCEYEIKDNLIMIHDTVMVGIKEIWLEKQWRYGEKSNQTIISTSDKGYQLGVNLKNSKSLSKYEKSWFIGIDTKKCFRSSGQNSLMSDLGYLPSDTIKYLIQSSKILSPRKEKDVIGELVFIRIND